MKGVVFAELLNLVEREFGVVTLEKIIEQSDLKSGGAYTSVGTYDYQEVLELVTHLSEEVEVPIPDLCKVFGEYFFGCLVRKYPSVVQGIEGSRELLPKVQDVIHREVSRLYPEAQLPRVTACVVDDKTMVVDYSSQRPFADVAEGLLAGCYKHFQEECQITREDLSDPVGTAARFTITSEARVALCQN